MAEQLKKYYFTFGGNHLDKNGFSLFNNYVVIEAESEGAAREKMHEARGEKYCTSYPESMADEAVFRWNVKSLTLEEVTLDLSSDQQVDPE